MALTFATGIAIVGAAVFLRYFFRLWWSRSKLPLPPGPKGYPLIGSLLDLPAPNTQSWLFYSKWFKQYGDMVYFEAAGQPFLILGSVERATDLLEKRLNYSDRKQMVMIGELMGWSFSFGIAPYGPRWRDSRRLFHRHFSGQGIQAFRAIQLDEARALAFHLLEFPQGVKNGLRRAFAGTIMRGSYGIRVDDDDSEYMEIPEIAMQGLSEAGAPGAFLVDMIPAMKFIPSLFPGAGWKRKAEYWRSITDMMRLRPFEVTRDQVEKGTALPSVASKLIESLPPRDDPSFPQEEEIAINIPAVAYSAGSDTTISTVQGVLFALAMHPDIVKKAQDEIDRVVGTDRLPTFEDESSLHYVRAICKEGLRWHNVAPMGVPHMATEADEYDGYYIPKGTMLLACSWEILHDPKNYEDPFSFKPERFIKDGVFDNTVPDPAVIGAFGFGRRGCPGKNLAENSLFSITVTILSVFDILPPLDDQGVPRKLIYEATGGMASFPKDFDILLKPRSAHAEQILRSYNASAN